MNISNEIIITQYPVLKTIQKYVLKFPRKKSNKIYYNLCLTSKAFYKNIDILKKMVRIKKPKRKYLFKYSGIHTLDLSKYDSKEDTYDNYIAYKDYEIFYKEINAKSSEPMTYTFFDLNMIHNIDVLDISNINNKEEQLLDFYPKNIKKIILHNFSYYLNKDYFDLSDYSNLFCFWEQFINIKNIELNNSYIIDLTFFTNVKYINLSDAYPIHNVSALSNAYEVNLNGCDEIEDFSVLKNIHTLSLDCTNITDSDLKYLSNVQNLSLNCTNITDSDLKYLSNVQNLSISSCDIQHIYPIRNVPILDISYNENILDFQYLGKQIELNANFTNISDVSHLSNVKILNICESHNVININMLTNLKVLNICDCQKNMIKLPNTKIIPKKCVY